jgi:phosphate transport system ATP-binding protein
VALSVQKLNLFYGSKQALHERQPGHPARPGGGLHRPQRLRQVDAAALLQPHERPGRQLPHRGPDPDRRQDIYDRSVNVAQLRRRVGMVFQKPNPFPKSIYENVAYGLRLLGVKNRAQLDEVVERSLKQRGAVGRGQGPARHQRPEPVRRPAAAPGDRARHRAGARGAAAGRTLLGARPHRHRQGRGTAARTQERVHHRHRHAQHAAGGAGVDFTAYMYLGKLIEYSPTRQLFMKPARRETEDYITGRFG